MEQLLLWRWSTLLQITSLVMIALFFLVLSLSTKRTEFKPWVLAWLANLTCLLITVIYWLTTPTSTLMFKLSAGGYVFSKTLFLLLLLKGLQRFLGRSYSALKYYNLVIISGVIALLAMIIIPSISWLGAFQSGVICITLTTGAVMAMRSNQSILIWLAVGLAARATLAFLESLSFTASILNPQLYDSTVSLFLSAHSSFDSAAEWWIALGCVLTLYQTIQKELTITCENLIKVKDELQELVDLDELTGLGNRRILRQVLDKAKVTGATLFFFDIDNFKELNDKFGHSAGDQCLKLFATALKNSFRPDDHLIRFAGDEFVVVAQSVTPKEMTGRVESTKQYLRTHNKRLPDINFSVGTSYLGIGEEPDQALHEADSKMYSYKTKKQPANSSKKKRKRLEKN